MTSTEAATSDTTKSGKRRRESSVDGYRSNDEDKLTEEHVCDISSLADMCIPVVAEHADLQDVVAKLPQHLVQRVSGMQKESVAYLMALGRTLKCVEKLHPSRFGSLVETLAMLNIPQCISGVFGEEAVKIRSKWVYVPHVELDDFLRTWEIVDLFVKRHSYTVRLSEYGQYLFRAMPSTSPAKRQKLLDTIGNAGMLEMVARFFGERDRHHVHPASEFQNIPRQLCTPLLSGMKRECNVHPMQFALKHKTTNLNFIRFQYDKITLHVYPLNYEIPESQVIADTNELFNFVMSEKLQ